MLENLNLPIMSILNPISFDLSFHCYPKLDIPFRSIKLGTRLAIFLNVNYYF